MARMLVRSWQETYRGLMPDRVLDDPGLVDARERFWTAALVDERYRANRIAVAERDGVVIGVAMAGSPESRSRDGVCISTCCTSLRPITDPVSGLPSWTPSSAPSSRRPCGSPIPIHGRRRSIGSTDSSPMAPCRWTTVCGRSAWYGSPEIASTDSGKEPSNPARLRSPSLDAPAQRALPATAACGSPSRGRASGRTPRRPALGRAGTPTWPRPSPRSTAEGRRRRNGRSRSRRRPRQRRAAPPQQARWRRTRPSRGCRQPTRPGGHSGNPSPPPILTSRWCVDPTRRDTRDPLGRKGPCSSTAQVDGCGGCGCSAASP